MVLYFKKKCTCFSPLSPTMSIFLICTTSWTYKIFQKILTPSKITLLLHRFIKKFLKIFQANANFTATPPPPQTKPENQPFSPKQMDVEPNSASNVSFMILKIKCVTILTTLLCSGQQVLLKLRCHFALRFSVRNRAQFNK